MLMYSQRLYIDFLSLLRNVHLKRNIIRDEHSERTRLSNTVFCTKKWSNEVIVVI